MKTISRLSALVVGVIVAAMVVAPKQSFGQGYINVSTYNGLGPFHANQQFVNDTTYALLNGLSQYGSWATIPNGSSVNTSNVFVSSQIGNAMYSVLVVTSSIPFQLSQVQVSSTSPLFSFSGTLGQLGFNTYSLFGIGIGTNGATITTGSDNAWVYAAYAIGINYSINITGETPAQAMADWMSVGAFTVTDTYSYCSSSASVSTRYDPAYIAQTPEPSTITLGIIGISILATYTRRRKH